MLSFLMFDNLIKCVPLTGIRYCLKRHTVVWLYYFLDYEYIKTVGCTIHLFVSCFLETNFKVMKITKKHFFYPTMYVAGHKCP